MSTKSSYILIQITFSLINYRNIPHFMDFLPENSLNNYK
jgi:hypothetical protein